MTRGIYNAPAGLANSISNAVRIGLNDNALAYNETLKACIHEAAHTVAARMNGFPVKWVSIDPEFIRNDPVAIETGNADGSALCMAISSPWIGPIVERGRMMTKVEKELVRAYGVQVLAGPVAERFFDPATYNVHTGAGDIAQLDLILSWAEPRKFERKKLRRSIVKDTDSFVWENQPQIVTLANALQERQTIMEPEIDLLLADFGISYERAA